MAISSLCLHPPLTIIPSKITSHSNSQSKTPKLNTKSNPKSFTSTLKSLSKSGNLETALQLIESSPDSLITDDYKSAIEAYRSVLHACITEKSFIHGDRLYRHLQRLDLVKDQTLKAKLITLFSAAGRLDVARRIFNSGGGGEAVWAAMAIGYLKNGYSKEALIVYVEMLENSVRPSNFAFSMAIKSCCELSDLNLGRAVHAQIVKCFDDVDEAVNNALLKFYSDCGCAFDALKVFDKMPQRNIVSWNSLISSLVSSDRVFDALETFRRMQALRVGFNWVTLTTILPAISQITALKLGKEIHTQIIKSNRDPDTLVLNSLMDMYAKCGEFDLCKAVFHIIPLKDLTSWNTMITACSINGKMISVMALFNEMIHSGFQPDEVTFIAMLSGCSHGALTKDGLRLFERMEREFGVSPCLEHYACLVDILGRAGQIEKAVEVVETMPMKPSGSVWGSLLNSCRLHGNVSVGERVAKQLFELEPDNPGNYVMLSNIYANASMWSEAQMVRETMERRGIKKDAGCSWIQVKDQLHTFLASGAFKFRNSTEYKQLQDELDEAMRKTGYMPNTSVVLHNVDELMKSTWVCGHSERLAAMYGLINTGTGMTLRIMKNLRVCVDCHSWMKAASLVTGRVIILRDTNRFHHFKNGYCSCNDYW